MAATVPTMSCLPRKSPIWRSLFAAVLLSLCTGPLVIGCKTAAPGRVEIKDIFGPDGRAAQIRAKDRMIANGSLAPLKGQEEFDAAQALYDGGNYKEAEKAFRGVIRQYQGKPITENALFMLAESQFQQERFPKAQDSYNELLNKFESSRYLEQTTKRLFTIAQQWLDFPEDATSGEILLATGGDGSSTTPIPTTKEKRPPALLPNLFDHRRPAFDTDGRALEALKAIWLNRPTGKLADDAVMMTAVYHLRTGDYLESKRFFEMLREQYPDSPHASSAYKLESHVIQMGYQGPCYDGQSLDKAKELSEGTLSLFPNSEDQERIKKSLARIDDARARRAWERVRYRLRRSEKVSAEINCHTLITDFPKSRFVKLAKEKLEELQAERTKKMDKASRKSAKVPEMEGPAEPKSMESAHDDSDLDVNVPLPLTPFEAPVE